MLWGKFTYRWDLFLSALSATNKLKEKLHDSNYFIKKIVEKNMQVSEISQPCYILLSWLTHVSTKKSMHRFSDLSNSYRDSIFWNFEVWKPFWNKERHKTQSLFVDFILSLNGSTESVLVACIFPGSACYKQNMLSFNCFLDLFKSFFGHR